MTRPEIIKISQIQEDQSVVCIVGGENLPGFLNLNDSEKEYAVKRIREGEETIFLNSIRRVVYLVVVKDGKNRYKTREETRRHAYRIRKAIRSGNHGELVITSADCYSEAVYDFTEGFVLGIYSFSKYKTKSDDERKNKYPGRLLLYDNITDQECLVLNETINAVWFARDLINEPVNHLNAVALAGEIRKAGESAGFSVEVLNKGKIEALKMGGILAVNKGSVDPPVLCIMEWKPEGHVNSKPVVLVGKGIVFDSGGLNLKPGDSMAGMKSDMAGAAIVTGVLHTAAKTGIPLHIIGLVPSTDNRPGGNAYAQGDIITMYNRLTVEIGNTDAEGRLILADAISYSAKYSPEIILDVATLTGSAAMTFGNQAIAMMTNADRKYFKLLEESGNEVYERIAELPFWEEYGEMLKSDVADLKNIGGKEAGAITAGKFLERFAEAPLIHLDIAGTELLKKDEYYRVKNGPATGLRLLVTFLKKLADNY